MIINEITPTLFVAFVNKNEKDKKKKSRKLKFSASFEPLVGFEPTTPRLQITCSGQLS